MALGKGVCVVCCVDRGEIMSVSFGFEGWEHFVRQVALSCGP